MTRLIDAEALKKALEDKGREACEHLWPAEFINGLICAVNVLEDMPTIHTNIYATPDDETVAAQMKQISEIIGSMYTQEDCSACVLLANGNKRGIIEAGDTFSILHMVCAVIGDLMCEHFVSEKKVFGIMEKITENVIMRMRENRAQTGDTSSKDFAESQNE